MNLLKLNTLTPLVLGLYSVAMLACGPADESVQRELGNLPSGPTAAPQVAAPPDAARAAQSSGTAQEKEDPEPTFTPLPTFCTSWPDEWEGGNDGVMCVHPKQYPTPVYPKLEGFLSKYAERADETSEASGSSGTRSAEAAEKIRVIIYPTTPDDVSTITDWLEDNSLHRRLVEEGTPGVRVESFVPANQLGALSELPEVDLVRQVVDFITPH